MLSPEYVAGFFDGEGCISIIYYALRKWKSDPAKRIMGIKMAVLVSNTHTETLQIIKKQFGGYLHVSNRLRVPRHKAVLTLRFSNTANQLHFLQTIEPFSVVKKEQIQIALRFLSTKQKPGHRPTQSEWQIRLECYEQMIALNKRGNGAGHTISPPLHPSLAYNPKLRGYTNDELAAHMTRMRAARRQVDRSQ